MLLYPIMYNTLLRVIWNWVLRGAPKLGERERERTLLLGVLIHLKQFYVEKKNCFYYF